MDTSAIERLVGPENVARVSEALTSIVYASFEVCPGRLTRAAVKERVDLAVTLLFRLKRDLGWSLPRTLDHVAEYLVYELERVPYAPATGRTWTTGPRRTPGGLVLPH